MTQKEFDAMLAGLQARPQRVVTIHGRTAHTEAQLREIAAIEGLDPDAQDTTAPDAPDAPDSPSAGEGDAQDAPAPKPRAKARKAAPAE